MDKYCFSCGAPLNDMFASKAADKFCKYCSDENGKLHSRESVQQGIAGWLKTLDPANTTSDYMKRADHYMKAMPAWAED